jgi:parallel beta-helix repeat protein
MNRTVLTSFIILFLVSRILLGLMFEIRPVRADSGTIYISADGSINPPWAPIHTSDNVTYTFIDNISSDSDGIVVERDNIVLDGAGYTLQGTGIALTDRSGIYLTGTSNVTVKNTKIEAFFHCIYLDNVYGYSSNNCIVGNNLTASEGYGICLWYSSSDSMVGNNITNNSEGIFLYMSSDNSIVANNITTNSNDGIGLDCSRNNSIVGNNITNNSDGIYLDYSSNNSIVGNDVTTNNYYGIGIGVESSSNTVGGNNITTNNGCGVYLWDSSNCNSIVGNNITNNSDGIYLDYSSNNRIVGNDVTANGNNGTFLTNSSNNTIVENNVADNGDGIDVWYSSDKNSICENNITNSLGIYLWNSSNNMFLHNNMDNSEQVRVNNSANTWNSDYPSGGNYWSDYTGVDANGDGIGDTSYVIDADNQDRCPLMHPWSSLPVHDMNTGLGYATIQEAIDANETLNGHTIFVEAGTYYENVVVNKTVSLIGEDRDTTLINGHEMGWAIQVVSNNVTVSDFTILNATTGIILTQIAHARIERNYIRDCQQGFSAWLSFYNVIKGNTISSIIRFSDSGVGVVLRDSDRNVITENTVTLNEWTGVYVFNSSDNELYHNNFVNNARQVLYDYTSVNAFDDGYPSGGNYWSDYDGTDLYSGPYHNETESDGIGDSPYIINANNTDLYPLMGTFNNYNLAYFTPPSVPHICNVTVISNSTISDVVAPIWLEHPEVTMLEFKVTGEQGTAGFCRVSFPTSTINGTYHVSVNGTEIPYVLLPCSNADYSYLYFTYSHSTEDVIITPEFPSFLILTLFIMATLIAVAVCRRKYTKNHGTER